MDEMAIACGLDPIELRIRNEPDVDPESGLPYSSRQLVACLREGARRFGWERREPTPRTRRDRGWLVGSGVAASTFPTWRLPGSAANIRIDRGGRYVVSIGAADMGTGARTALTQIAADALGVALGDVELQIGDTALPTASTAGASAGITSWGSAIFEAARKLRAPGCGRPGIDAVRRTGGHGRDAQQSPRRAVLDACVRGAIRRGACARGHRRGAGASHSRRLRRRQDHQPQDRPFPAARGYDDGPFYGAARRQRAGPAVRP